MPPAPELPEVVVLLATYNGRRWLPEQLASILDQEGVRVRVVALDDESTDGTREWLVEQSAADPRVTVLPPMGSSGGSAPNFYRLIGLVPAPADGYLAFSDQDDIWLQGKLARHVRLLREGSHDGVSGSITSFSPTGERTLIRKDFPQRRYDYLTESPGPGSTFVLTPRLAALVAAQLADDSSPARTADFHDSLIYALARGAGYSWHIDGQPTLDYRQHDDNVMGSNTGIGSALSRFRLIREHWHRQQAIVHARAALKVAPPPEAAGLEGMLALLEGTGIRARFALARRCGQMRRRPRDARIIGLLIAIGVW